MTTKYNKKDPVISVNQYGDPVDNDSSTGATTTIEYEHHEIHAGNHFFVCGYGTYAADEDVDFQLTTPDTTKEIHMTFNISGTGAATIKIYEGAAVGAGTPVTAYNNNRNSDNTTDLELLQIDGAITTAGTLIYSNAFGSGTNPSSKQSGVASRNKEIILKRDTTYRFFIESDAAANVITWCGEWYEHTPKH